MIDVFFPSFLLLWVPIDLWLFTGYLTGNRENRKDLVLILAVGPFGEKLLI